jgi:glucose uptake protein GlcU
MIKDIVYNLLIIIGFIAAMTVVLTIVCRDYRHFTGLNRRDDANIYQALFDRFYFVLVTISTMGYGDISPVSNRAKASVIIIIMFVVVIILNAFSNIIDGYNKYVKKIVLNLVDSGQDITSKLRAPSPEPNP